MRSLRLLLTFTVLLTFCNSKLFSQINGSPSARIIFAPDSLAGFDETAAQNYALSAGFYGIEFQTYLNQQKRAFINSKYHLQTYAEYESWSIGNFGDQSPVGNSRYSSATTNNAPCTNEDFESGTLSGWSASVGVNGDSQTYTTTPTPISAGAQVTVVSTPFSDAVVGTIPNSPLGGTKVVRINNTVTGTGAVVKLAQTFSVTPTNYLYDFAYWAVMQNATNHSCNQTPYMLVKIRNFANTLQGCPNFSIVAPSTGAPNCAGIGPTSWSLTAGGIQTSVGWQKFSIDLTPYMSQNVTIEVIVAHCSLQGHYGYAYFDSNCNTMNLTVNNTQTLSMPSTTVYPQVLCGSNATLTAPSGLGPYAWFGPAGTFTNLSSQTVTTSIPGNYTLNMSPTGICNPPLQKIINLQFVPPTTVTASPANLCASGTNTSSTLSASGASQYTWQPGGSNLSSIVVTPTITTIYTLTAKTGTCVGTYTVEVTVNPDPVVSVVSSNFSVCPGQSATLTAFGANSYAWNPGALTGSQVIVSPGTTTTYTTVGTSTAGCTGSVTTNINVSPALSLNVVALTATYNCAGTPVTFVAGGATTFTWLPNNVTGFFQTFSPTVTTNYTVIGASGACTATTNITASVNPGPSITITPNPASVCPGNSTTLSAVAPGAVGAFTWQPGAINATSIVVTPTLAGGYSVSAIDAMGCKSTYTANPIESPLPNIVISPSTPSVCQGSSVTLSATGGVSYTWQPGNLSGASISVAPAVNTTYTVTGANAAGCTSTSSVTVTVSPLPNITASASPTAVCAGACSTITPGGGTSYTISGGSFVVCPLVNTSYTVTGQNAAGCLGTPAVVAVNVNASPNLSITATPTAICSGGSSNLTVSGATSYTWVNTGTTGPTLLVTPTITTTYTAIGINASGCTSSITVQVIVNPVPSVSVSPSAATVCVGSSTTLIASGATSYTWFPGGSTGTSLLVSPLVNTSYTVIGATSGCTNQAFASVVVSPAPAITASFTPATICAGSCATLSATGALTYTITGLSAIACPTTNTSYTVVGSNASGCISNTVVGTLSVTNGPALIASASPATICPGNSSNLTVTGGISYTWQPVNLNGASISVSPTITTTYTVTGDNASGCTSTQTVTVFVNPAPNINATANSATICAGGTSTLTATGASGYFWMPGALSGTNVFVSPSTTTNYTVTGTLGGCGGTAFVTVVVNPAPTVSISASPLSICQGGSSTLTASGASNYTWSTGSNATSIVVSPSVTTSYSLTGSSAFGCPSTNTAVVTIIVNPAPTLSLSANPATVCAGSSSTLTASGAIAYTWQPGNLSGSPVIVTPSLTTTYTATGVNASGCTSTQSITVTVNPAISLFAAASPTAICAGSSAVLTGGGASTYTWLPGPIVGNPVTVTPTASIVYTLIGASAGCTAQTTIAVNVTPSPTVNITATSTVVCAGSCATLSAFGAASFTWSTGSTGPSIVVCPTLSTTYTVIGATAGCTGLATTNISVSPLPSIFASPVSSTICAGSSTSLTASGGVSYTWQPGNLFGAFVTVSPTVTTIYTLTGINAAGCSGTATAQVIVNPIPNVSASASSTNICAGQSVTLSATGAGSYTWNPGGLVGTPVIVTPLVPTLYSVVGLSSGCTGSASVVVIVNPAPTLNVNASASSICVGGSVTFTATGGTSYTWQPGGSTANPLTVSPLASTVYTVTGTSGPGCAGTQTIGVTVNSLPNVSISASSNPICSGASATLNATGATNYTWSTGPTGPAIAVSPVSTTVYSVIGSNGSGCSASANFTLTVNPSPAVSISASSPTVCAGFTVGLLGIGAPSFTWFPGGTTGNPIVVTPLASTIYTAIGSNGACTSSATINITMIPLPSVSVAASSTLLCTGSTVTLSASGASTYSWIPSLVGGSTFTDTPAAATVYTVVGFSSAGCPNFATVAVNVLPPPVINATASSTAICIGDTATLIATGATNYTWQPGSQTGASIVVSPGSNTTYTVTGDNGSCAGITTIGIVVNPLPVISASAAPSPLCAGSTVTLSAFGAVNYTWNPIGLSGNTVTDNPLNSITYTVIGVDANGCSNTSGVFVNVTPGPTVAATANQTLVCEGSSVNLTATGALNYTWSPNGQLTASIVETPNSPTTYSVVGIDANGCTGLATVFVNTVANPTLNVTPLNSSVCIGSSATLTASGATSYTWLPSATNGSVTVETPLANTTYTVLGDNAGLCFASFTVDVFVNPLPANVTASSTGTVSCASPTAALFGNCSDPNISYSWSGPSGFSSSVQNPTISGVWGNFTLSVTNTITGCIATATVDVATDNSIPSVTATTSGSITCSFSVVTLNAANTTTNPAYSWNGPGNFTSTAQTFTVAVAGTYTVKVTDLSSTCSSTATVTVGTHTNVSITASITPPTCANGNSNNDGKISVAGFTVTDKFDLVVGTSYTGTATYANAAIIPVSGVITNNLANPSTTVAYTIRLFDGEGCIKDTTLFLVPVDCSLKTLGIAKAVSVPQVNTDGSYNLTYTIVTKNYDLGTLKNISLTENLSATFPGPSTSFTVTAPPISTGFSTNSSFDGVTQTNLLSGSTNSLFSGLSDTIRFSVKVKTSLFFVPFKNTVLGSALNMENKQLDDSSNTGLDPDPDNDKNPYNNNIPTVIIFTPNTFFGITKVGEINRSDNDSYDVSYTVTVHNLGNDTVKNVSLKDSLFGKTIKSPASYSMRSAPVVSGNGLVANSAFDGKTDSRLILPSQSNLPPNTVTSVHFIINVVPGEITSISNSAYGNGQIRIGLTTNTVVSDTSNAGNDPDSNDNGVWNEAADNVPTVLLIPNTHTLFIPEGFSPNGDNINPYFTIQGLPTDRENSLTIFNRWGNKVYYSSNYDNSWDGTPNVSGTLGKNKLPQGTYFYILDMKGSGVKPITGFIVLSY